MATDATGTPTSPDSIPKYNTAADAPSGLGFNAAMDQIQTVFNGKVSKPSGIVSGEVPVWNGTTWVRSSVTNIGTTSLASGTPDVFKAVRGDGTWGNTHFIYDKTSTRVSATNTAVETTIYTKQINANDLGTGGVFILEASGFSIHNNAAGDTLTVRVKYGGTAAAITANALGGTINAAARPWFVKAVLKGDLATNVQELIMRWDAQLSAGNGFTGDMGYVAPAIDSTVNQNLIITAQWSAASVNNVHTLTSAVLTRIQ